MACKRGPIPKEIDLEGRLVTVQGEAARMVAQSAGERWLASEESGTTGVFDRHLRVDEAFYWFSDRETAFAFKLRFG